MPQTPPSRIAADTVKRYFSPRDQLVRQARVAPMVKILAANRAEQQSPREPFMDKRDINSSATPPASSPAVNPSIGSLRQDKDIGDTDDGGWEVPESPLKPKRKRYDRRQLVLRVQLMVRACFQLSQEDIDCEIELRAAVYAVQD